MTITLLAPDGVAVTAQQERQARAAHHGGGSSRPLGGRSGFRANTATNILTASSTTWTLLPFAAMIDPGAATHQGMYGVSSDANITGAVTAADATYGRVDIVYVQVNDSSAGDGSSGTPAANVLYLAGTPSASPAAPSLPPRSFLVGTITVPVAGGGSPTVQLNTARYVAAGAPLPVFSQAERDALTSFDGFRVQRRDVNGAPVETSFGGSWYRQPVSVEHSLAVADAYFSVAGGLVKTVTAGITQVTATLQLTRTSSTPIQINITDSALLVGLIPAGFRPTANHFFPGTSNTDAGARYAEPQLVINTGGTLVGRSTSGGSVTIAQNYVIFISTTWYI